MLEDSAQIQEKNIEQENKRRIRMHQAPRFPLYTQEDAKACMPLFSTIEYTKTYKMNDAIEVRFQDAGHIMGSASIELFVTEGGKKTKLVFS
jgi:metallo-beta-lactamase family protein